MPCSEAVRLMDDFLSEKLPLLKTLKFIEHIESCPDCFDELEIRYLIRYADEIFDERMTEDGDHAVAFRDLLTRRKKQTVRIIYGGLLLLLVLLIAAIVLSVKFIL